jgi:restriction endonuclease S subunit
MNFVKKKIKEIMTSPSTNSGLKKKDVSPSKKSDNYLPVYSASQNENLIFGWVSKEDGWKSYKNVLTWNKDGSSGIVFYRKEEFVPYEKVKILEIRDELKSCLDYNFLKFIIENKLLSLGFNFGFKASMERVLEVEIKIPIDKNGNFDIEKQKSLAERYEKISSLKMAIENLYNTILNVNVSLEEDYKCKSIEISELFYIKKGQSKYTRDYIRNHKGEYPLYSSQTVNEGIIGFIDSCDFDEECITWTTDGIYAGTVFYRKGKFSMTTHCGALIPKKEILNNLDLSFIFFQMKKMLKDYAVGEGNKRITTEIIGTIPIQIPIDKNGNFDIEKQKEIVRRLSITEKVKDGLKNKFEPIVNYKIDFEEAVKI